MCETYMIFNIIAMCFFFLQMCNRHFTTPSSLSRHRETHFQVEHKCNFCNNSFKHWDYLREHLNICVARYKEN